MESKNLKLPGVRIIRTKTHEDVRGSFTEIYNKKNLADAGIKDEFVQDNITRSVLSGTVRGLHFQKSPHAQAKIIRVLKGRILDVVVDIRHGSPTYGQHDAVELDANIGLQLYAPVGVAHGFVTLEPDTEVMYKVSSHYAPDSEGGVRWDDPDLAIDWRVEAAEITIADRDAKLPCLSELPEFFTYAANGNPS
ncbi:MAG: dTDP-4-dehydrorhamnose 3,5-epimerase [Rhodospirillaceae bacterium]|jgi:dTDP-4-dehydrorhamnose 3,5-epimerase|nr:dTDP-4-dehydrorhamnose 3,5-epimerase [Rhodospirillaceae bacterium]MBT7484749.1 dTDP-4-dehydrorhamnose 3,5-epimerase [Rhodospirillales bacterium]MBT4702330.1 dTDP-4-dehydrorhamnose 3,5-epimerase [Rhodospirillaceae bacterium]MBT5034458.1 dTDP-4-dehydrorhamnose 3,5-epimerase [Rhodospirillaceae bacterium]MBT6220120.1 dTDP-4-dehydrorhamnose 3,5-epimerase [Rhodospirillaceae bacterium]